MEDEPNAHRTQFKKSKIERPKPERARNEYVTGAQRTRDVCPAISLPTRDEITANSSVDVMLLSVLYIANLLLTRDEHGANLPRVRYVFAVQPQ